MSYDREQLRLTRAINRIARQRYKDPKLRKRRQLTGISIGLVETGMHNLKRGDQDSVNLRQERASIYGGDMNVGRIVNRMFDEMDQLDRGQSKGELAADIQRPREDLRGKYGLAMGEAKQLRRAAGGAKGSKAYALTGRGGTVKPGTRPRMIPGGETVDRRGALVAALLDGGNGSLLKRWQGEIASGTHTTTTKAQVVKGTPAKYDSTKVSVKGFNADVGEVEELFWNGPGARNIKDGQRVKKGFVEGHTDHVHVAIGDREEMKRAVALARSMGLNVGGYGKGITSGHATNSHHYEPYGAADVSGARMREYARRIAKGRF